MADDHAREVTTMIQRVEAFEDRAGVSLDGLYARIEYEWTPGPILRINGEVRASSGTNLEHDVSLQADVLDANGCVVAMGDERLWKDDFFGFESFSIALSLEGLPEPSRIRLYPKVRT